MRRAHFLRANKSSSSPHNCIWVDTETTPVSTGPREVSHVLRFGWACHQRTRRAGQWTQPDWYRFETPQEFWSWLRSKLRSETRLYLFAHNWSFDAPVLRTFTLLSKSGWTLSRPVVESPPTIMIWRRESMSLVMLDTLNWWRMPLARIGESVGFPKLTMPGPRAGRVAWDRYCKADVEVIRRVLHAWWDFLRMYDLGGFAHTLAGQALRTYRHRFMTEKVLIDDNAGALALARSSYHGGRTECFRLGSVPGPVHCLDVNSMYPAVMRDQAFPARLAHYIQRPALREVRRWLTRFCVVARCWISSDVPRYAHRLEDKLVFPVGEFVASLTTPDLIAALDAGHVHHILEASVYEPAPLFRSFVHDLYALRQSAARRNDVVAHWLLKILMNSLYGKFAQSGQVWDDIGTTEPERVGTWLEVDGETGRRFMVRAFAGRIQQRTQEPESYSSHPAIASHITAHARARLWDLMLRAGREHVYYCDTDSLYVDDAGLARLADCIDPIALGALKHEGTFQQAVFHGPKDYSLDGHVKVKGVRSKATWLAPDLVEQEQWSSLAGLIRAGQLEAPTTRTVAKRLARLYTKGTVARSGIVSPLRLREWTRRRAK